MVEEKYTVVACIVEEFVVAFHVNEWVLRWGIQEEKHGDRDVTISLHILLRSKEV